MKFNNKECLLVENRALPRPRARKLLLALYGKPYNSLRSAALDVVYGPDGATRSVFKCYVCVFLPILK